jgi:hypothetical protein
MRAAQTRAPGRREQQGKYVKLLYHEKPLEGGHGK